MIVFEESINIEPLTVATLNTLTYFVLNEDCVGRAPGGGVDHRHGGRRVAHHRNVLEAAAGVVTTVCN